MQYLIGYDLGSSSVKACLLDASTGKTLASASSPQNEMPMSAPQINWAEQDPELWWQELKNATFLLKKQFDFDENEVGGIGIAYQMHGLVMVDNTLKVLRPSIIWCDSRAVEIGNNAFSALGEGYCLEHYLNSPGNFTASKLRWVIENEPNIWEKTYKIMLPGDYVAMRMSDEIYTTVSGLSEGILWDFKTNKIANRLLDYYNISEKMIADITQSFDNQGVLSKKAANELGLKAGTPIAYRAGDQPNNAFSLNVLEPGEVAATAGTSGVVYGINEQAKADALSRVNSFVHVNHQQTAPRYGVLLCVNGTGSLNAWLHRNFGSVSYEKMNKEATKMPIGAAGLRFIPFGNGAERILENRPSAAALQGLNFNVHERGHVFRAAQEGIVSALHYGLKIMNEMGVSTQTIRAGYANMFLSPLFREAFANTTGATIELYNTDGAAGAARGAGLGIGFYKNRSEAFVGLEKIKEISPQPKLMEQYQALYESYENSFVSKS
jgi:xylulokinase